MHEFFIEEEKLEGLLQLASEKTGISKRELQEKLSGVMQDGKIVVNEQIYGLLSDPKKLEMLLNSGIVGRLLKELGEAERVMSELSDLLGGLLGSEAGKDSGGMDGLFDLLAGDAVRSHRRRKNRHPEEPARVRKLRIRRILSRSCALFPSCRMMIRISGCCGRFSRTLPRSGLPGQKMSSR